MAPELILTQEEWRSFNRYYTFHLVRNPEYRLGPAFYNYFPDKMDDLRENSHLGGNPGHVPSLDVLLDKERDNKQAKSMIFDWFQFTPEEL